MASKTITTASYEGRYMQLDVSQSGTTLYWTFSVKGADGTDYSTGPTEVWLAGSRIYYDENRISWDRLAFPTRPGSTSGTVTVAKGTASVGMTIDSNYGWSGNVHAEGTLTLDSTYAAPSYNSTSSSDVTRTSVKLTASIDTDDATITDGGWDLSTNSGSSWTYYSGGPTNKTITGLTANTTYWFRGYVVTAGGSTNSSWKSFKTDHNAPTIGTRTYSYSRAASSLGSTYTATLSYSVTYDNASYSSRKIEYGTSTSYGSQVTNTKSISGLQPNKTYYYKITENDNSSKTSTATGSFTTPGIAPTLSVSASPTRTGCTLTGTISYDTNDSYSSRSIQYGTTTSYGSTSTSETLSGLAANTLYYYKYTVNTTKGQSKYVTGSFTTTGNAPTVNSVTPTPTRTGCTFTYTATFDTNASVVGSPYIEYGTTTSYGSHSSSSITGLSPNTKYYYRLRITDNFSRTSSWYTGDFTTTGNVPTISNGSVSNIKSKSCTISVVDSYDTNANLSVMTIRIYLGNILVNTITSSTNSKTTGDILKPGKNYTANVTVTDNFGRTSSVYVLTFKTKGGFKFDGRMSDSAKFNGREVIGMKFNGVEII